MNRGTLRRRATASAAALLLLVGCADDGAEAEPDVEPDVEEPEGPPIEPEPEDGAAEIPEATDGAPEINEAAASYVDETFAGSDYQASLVDVFGALGAPDVESVEHVEYLRETHTIDVVLTSGLDDAGDLRQIAWILTELWAFQAVQTDVMRDLEPRFDLTVNRTTWSCSGSDVVKIAEGELLERHWAEACS